MTSKTQFFDLKTCLVIVGAFVLSMVLFSCNTPKPTQTQSRDIKKSARVEMDEGTIETSKDGQVKATGRGIKLDVDYSDLLDLKKYSRQDWMVTALYSTSSELDISVSRNVLGGLYVVGGVRANMLPTPHDPRLTVGVCFVF